MDPFISARSHAITALDISPQLRSSVPGVSLDGSGKGWVGWRLALPKATLNHLANPHLAAPAVLSQPCHSKTPCSHHEAKCGAGSGAAEQRECN